MEKYLSIKETSFLYKIKSQSSHLLFKKIFIFECSYPSEKKITLQKRFTPGLVTLSPAAKESSSFLRLLSFKKVTFTLASNAQSHYYLRLKRGSYRASLPENTSPTVKKSSSLHLEIPRLETSSSRSGLG